MAGSLRDLIRDWSPTWLSGGRFERYMYACGQMMDLLVEKTIRSVHMRIPTACDVSALPFIGGDRDLPRSPIETEDAYRTRLQKFAEEWSRAGGPWGLLREVRFVLSVTPMMRVVSAAFDYSEFPAGLVNAQWNTYEADADTTQPPSRLLVTPGNWDWDSLSPCHGSWAWSRIWTIVYAEAPNDWAHEVTEWTLGDDDVSLGNLPGCMGLDCDPDVAAALLDRAMTWKGEHSGLVYLVVALDPELFDPAEEDDGVVNPDGTYGQWSAYDVNGDMIIARTIEDARYCTRVEHG